MKSISLLIALLALLIAACGSVGGSGSPGPSQVATPEEAAKLVLASNPRFTGIGPRDPNLIGQAAWYEASIAEGGFKVDVRIGWGDCPAGCINEHRWTYTVDGSGRILEVLEGGDPLPADGTGDGNGGLGVSGRVLAGPTCPVQQNPPDPNCADRPVAGAVLVVNDDAGAEVARAVSGADGSFSVALPAGHYVLVPQPVEGLLGTAGPIDFTLGPGGPTLTFDVLYDTGIR